MGGSSSTPAPDHTVYKLEPIIYNCESTKIMIKTYNCDDNVKSGWVEEKVFEPGTWGAVHCYCVGYNGGTAGKCKLKLHKPNGDEGAWHDPYIDTYDEAKKDWNYSLKNSAVYNTHGLTCNVRRNLRSGEVEESPIVEHDGVVEVELSVMSDEFHADVIGASEVAVLN